MKLYTIILNYNGGQDTLDCLASLQKIKKSAFEHEIIVVDNASHDDSVARIKKEYPQVTVLVNHQNVGFAEGNNVGVRFALKQNADFVLILNNDTLVDPELFIELLAEALHYKTGGIFGPKIYFAKGAETHPERYASSELGNVLWYAGGKMDWQNVLGSHRGVDEVDKGQYNETVKTAFVTGCAMFVKREVFETVGIFDSKFYLYYEDVDFCERARKKGYELYYTPKAVVWHKNANSSGGTGSDLQSYFITRNRLLIGMRYATWKTRLALFREALNLLMTGSTSQKQAVGDFLRKKYGSRQKMWEWKTPNINLMKMFQWEKKQKK